MSTADPAGTTKAGSGYVLLLDVREEPARGMFVDDRAARVRALLVKTDGELAKPIRAAPFNQDKAGRIVRIH